METTFRQRRLGKALRVLRERARLTQIEAARGLRYDHRKLSRIENGQRPEYHAFRAMLDLYGLTVPEWEPYLDLYDRACEKGWWQAYGLEDQGFISVENDATAVREFQLGYVPGLLQTEDYMREVFGSSSVARSEKWIDAQVEIRLRRQQRLIEPEPLRLHAIVAESALRTSDRQRRVVRRRMELPNVTVQVLPSGFHDGLLGSFTVLDLPEHHGIVYVEHVAGSVHIDGPERVGATRLLFEHLSERALTPEQSAAWIEGQRG
ncbi:helix-turn-helix domain-containing protein [Umezawaea beigongshangensis]|uniref:helix-turn-helix domain-containing protein n=1 Tax=Umezawaea beigongshangensis TaxID=2780383 RepID=UPI0018F1E0EC|nr:helix-turn-helix transcriptional regulator [Umezawaea beigongshangensis]